MTGMFGFGQRCGGIMQTAFGMFSQARVSITTGFAGSLRTDLFQPLDEPASFYSLDTGCSAAEGFLEPIPANPGMDAHFTRYWQASVGWDGTDQVRPFM